MATKNSLQSLVSKDSLKGISKATGIDASDVSNVLSQALPLLLQGASKQTSSKTADSFATALSDHASVDVSNLASFFKNIDLEDGAKIVSHLVGNSSAAEKKIAKSTGIDVADVAKIIAAAAPLFMTLLGKQTNANSSSSNTNATLELASTLLSKVDVSSLATSLLSGLSGKTSSSNNKTGIDAGDVVDLLGKIIK